MIDMTACGRPFAFDQVTYVMGVINVSPESRNPHTVVTGVDDARALAHRYRDWGANLIDIGGQSSHFESPTLGSGEETSRLLPVVAALVNDGHTVSVDTWKPDVARAALEEGAHIVNDTGGLTDQRMVDLVSDSTCGIVAVHVDGAHPHDVGAVHVSADKAAATAAAFGTRMEDLPARVVDRLILDPGIAINYRGDYATYTKLQLDVIRNTGALVALGRPVLVPIPRKRDIHWVSAYITLALEYGADMIRVHDVAIAAELVRLFGREVAA